jgi:hypothetical protein
MEPAAQEDLTSNDGVSSWAENVAGFDSEAETEESLSSTSNSEQASFPHHLSLAVFLMF